MTTECKIFDPKKENILQLEVLRKYISQAMRTTGWNNWKVPVPNSIRICYKNKWINGAFQKNRLYIKYHVMEISVLSFNNLALSPNIPFSPKSAFKTINFLKNLVGRT